jgi:hypothetical protein
MIPVALEVIFALSAAAVKLGWAWAFFGVTLTIAGCALTAIVDN